MESIIKLFRAIIVETKNKKKSPAKVIERTIKSGFILGDEIIANYSGLALDKVIAQIEKVAGLGGSQLNSSFHKSWKKIKEAKIEQLVIEQIVHYITTYGYERLGIYDENTVFIPDEVLEIPALKALKIEKLNLILIKGYTKDELKDKLLFFLASGIALKEDTMKCVLDVATFLDFDINDVETIKNREVKIALYDYLALVPGNPVELLRYLVYKATNKTLLIKNAETIAQIKARNNLDILGILNRYGKTHGLEKLGEIFYRFKPLFLAFRTSTRLKTVINKIRKLAVKNHKPMPEDYLNAVTSKIKHEEDIVSQKLKEELAKVNTFRKIRLAYALKYRTHNADSILYKIRNGKGYAKDFNFTNKVEARKILKTVIKSIAKDIEPNISGKKIYIPENITYALPATEKQFTGMLPSGTCVTLPKDMIVGVYWEDVNGQRIDLDLSLVGLGVKFGWDARYCDEGRSILFSGDMTFAPKGASEMYYVKKQTNGNYLLFLNYFNYNIDVPVPFKIFVAYEQAKYFGANYMVNPNNIVAVASRLQLKSRKHWVF